MKEEIQPNAVYSADEAANILGLDVVTIQRYVRSKKLAGVKIGTKYRFTGNALLSFLRDQQDDYLEGLEAQLLVALADLELGKHATRDEVWNTKIWKSTRGINGEIKRIALSSISITDFMGKLFGVIYDAVDAGKKSQSNTQVEITKDYKEDFNKKLREKIQRD